MVRIEDLSDQDLGAIILESSKLMGHLKQQHGQGLSDAELIAAANDEQREFLSYAVEASETIFDRNPPIDEKDAEAREPYLRRVQWLRNELLKHTTIH